MVAVGPGVTDFKVGDRGAYAGAVGGYAEERVMPADRLVKLPDAVDYKTAAAMMLQGMTVRYLLRQTYKVGPGTTMLLHAAAGGVGLIAAQWAKHLGATVIGTAGSDDKVKLALGAGCTHVINYKTEDFVKRTRELTGGAGVDVVYDGVGKDTYPASLDCLKPLGMFVSFGNASGAVASIDPLLLMTKGSLFATRPTLQTYTAKREDLVANASDLFDVVSKGVVKITVNHTYASEGCGAGASRPGGSQDNWVDCAAAISRPGEAAGNGRFRPTPYSCRTRLCAPAWRTSVQAAQGHGDVELLPDALERLGHAGLAHGAEAVDVGAADDTRPWRRAPAP